MENIESDPTGRTAQDPGAKLDSGKLKVAMVLSGFANALEEVARVGMYGANKYSPHGWEQVPDGPYRYEDAEMRHKLKRWQGETIDPDSGLFHQAQEIWNLLASLELQLRKNV